MNLMTLAQKALFLGEFMNNFNAQIKPVLTFNQQIDYLINDKANYIFLHHF